MNNKFFKSLVACFALATSGMANAGLLTYEGATQNVGNCIPFGCPDSYGPHMGFVYQDIDAFTLNVGDTIAFDIGAVNDSELSFDLSLSATTVNGGTTAAGFSFVSSLGAGFYGDTVVGNYDLIFTATNTFTFNGGGLIVDFLNTNGPVNDFTYDQNLVYGNNNPNAVGRYYRGATAGDVSEFDSYSVGNFQVNTFDAIQPPTTVPEPSTLAVLALSLMGFASRKFSIKAK
ncbi:PEP-CTERM sorting domain-containing protein [Alteromonas confluentis]|uniref:Ice-binding protein C-terminal domain-containing protein n=1 Tax=Alteromonas confluentis TaxID=1656094 RepID=A0A1E7ZA64_9ALTE|nr:PEP-CTERM sorting domain-containing protein [Alteromonas confluentis]OFC70304.1 hypothetical protein BFC18_14100 [Alteromonas confluentis]